MHRNWPRILAWTAAVAALLVLAPYPANADVLSLMHWGTGSGTLNGVPFPPSPFLITDTVDTANRQGFTGGWFIDDSTASIEITGVGTFQIQTPTRTFVSNTGQLVGFSRAGVNGNDLFNGPVNPAFSTWDMLGPIGPFSGTGGLLQWSLNPQIQTSGGILIFDDRVTDARFQALPEPAALALAGLLAVLSRRHR